MGLSYSSPFYYFLPILDIDSWELGFGVVHDYSLEAVCSVDSWSPVCVNGFDYCRFVFELYGVFGCCR